MPLRFLLSGCVLLSVLSACASAPVKDTPSVDGTPEHEIQDSVLQNMRFTISDSHIRNLLTKVRQNFSVQLRHGRYDFPDAILMEKYPTAFLLQQPRAYGDLNGDRSEDVVVLLQIGSGETSRSELIVVATRSGSVRQVASFPLGQATVRSLSIRNGTVRASAILRLPQDPGPRKKEFVFRLPRAAGSASGSVRP